MIAKWSDLLLWE
jgi:hypothetical protein